uniref:Putative secreted protein n=1 Tax=Amblyomma triste TaxID=251400 RepID=A0A023G4M8_AMBTT
MNTAFRISLFLLCYAALMEAGNIQVKIEIPPGPNVQPPMQPMQPVPPMRICGSMIPDIIVLQKTWLTTGKHFHLQNYRSFRQGRRSRVQPTASRSSVPSHVSVRKDAKPPFLRNMLPSSSAARSWLQSSIPS